VPELAVPVPTIVIPAQAGIQGTFRHKSEPDGAG